MTTRVRVERRWLRWLGLVIAIYGVAGLVIAFAGGQLVSASFRGVDRLSSAILAQRNVLIVTLDSTANFLGSVGTSTDTVDATIADAATAVRQGATLARDLGAAADQVSLAAQFSILGQQPFLNVATSFNQVSTDARSLAENLETAATTVGSATGDTARIRGDLEAIATQIRVLGTGLSGSSAFESLEGAFDAPRLVLYAILAYMGVQAAAALLIGLALMLRPRIEARTIEVEPGLRPELP